MRATSVIHVVGCHAEGEVGDVIVGGVAAPPGQTVREQSQWIATDGRLRNLMLNEPRGGVFRHVNLLVPPKHHSAHMGFIIMEPEHTPLMSGSNAMCVATVLLETGIVEMNEPTTELILEAPGGLVKVTADCRNGKVERVTVVNLASFADKLDVMLELDGVGSIRVDTAFGGDSFVLVDAVDLGFEIVPAEAADLARIGVAITRAANEQIGFQHPDPALHWGHISFCQIAGPLRTEGGVLHMTSTSVIDPGKLDRSPTGTGVSARMAVRAARAEMRVGDQLVMHSIIDSTFTGTVAATASVGDQPAIIPEISGQAWITGTHQHMVDPTDPWPQGYRLSDTWPQLFGQ